jgi:hypothetical protein
MFGAPLVTQTLWYTVAGPLAETWIGAANDLLHDETSGVPLRGN